MHSFIPALFMFNKLVQRSFLCNVQAFTRIPRSMLFPNIRYYNTTGLRKSTHLPPKLEVQLKRKELTFDASSSFVPVLSKSQDTSNILQLPGDSHGGSFLLSWRQRPRTVLIIKKPNDSKTEAALVNVANWLHDQHPDLNILVEPDVAEHFREKLPFVYVIPNGKLEGVI